jgi:ATP-binding cassette subfamily B multidrug efflux pump
MDQGRIVEQGNHADLLARDGAYRALYRAQFLGGDPEEGVVDTADPALDAVGAEEPAPGS